MLIMLLMLILVTVVIYYHLNIEKKLKSQMILFVKIKVANIKENLILGLSFTLMKMSPINFHAVFIRVFDYKNQSRNYLRINLYAIILR